MSKHIASEVDRIARPIIETNGFELVDIEYVKEGGNWFLRVFVDKEGGIDIEDCGRISEMLSDKLDESDPIPNAYFLEVSSPGAERPLKKKEDFYRAVNKNVFITTYEPIDGNKEFEGKLLSYEETDLRIETLAKKTYVIPIKKVASARLAIVF